MGNKPRFGFGGMYNSSPKTTCCRLVCRGLIFGKEVTRRDFVWNFCVSVPFVLNFCNDNYYCSGLSKVFFSLDYEMLNLKRECHDFCGSLLEEVGAYGDS